MQMTTDNSSTERTQFAAGAADLCAAKLLYLFLFGSLIGYLAETLFFLARTGQYSYRGSLVFGPINTVYGIGALALYFAQRNLDKAGPVNVFAIGALAGTVVEFLCSWVQEAAFGTVSWDYSDMPLNIGGRVWPLSLIAWGVLSLLWVYMLHPWFDSMISKIPAPVAHPMAVCLFVLLAVDVLLSVAAVARWSMRVDGAPAIGYLSQLLDQLFPNATMEQVYESMRFIATP